MRDATGPPAADGPPEASDTADAADDEGLSSGRTLWVVVALTIIGSVLRVVNARQDLFADELATYWIVSAHDFEGVLRTVSSTAEITPPLSFVLSWLTSRAGETAFLVRLPALVAGIATVPLVYALGVRTVGRRAALLATGLTALSPFMVLYSAEARGYGVLMALLVLSTLALVLAVERGGVGWWALHGACVCLAMYTHYTSIFVLAGQALWCWWRHPSARRALALATGGAVVGFLPWLPSLRGDLDSPTTQILSSFSPLSVDMVRTTLGHWAVGYPYTFPTTSLNALPGRVSLLVLAVSVAIGARGLLARRPTSGRGPAVGLAVLLALATPVGTFVQSVASTNVFSVRSLAASWPYLALAMAVVLTGAAARWRVIAGGGAVAAFSVAALTMFGDEFERPQYGPVARFADEHDAAVVIDGVAFSPGPLTNLNVEGTRPDAPLLRLTVPDQLDRPFAIGDPLPDRAEVFERAGTRADGGPIVVASAGVLPPEMEELIALLPVGYEVTDELRQDGPYVFDFWVIVLERVGTTG